MLPDLLLQENSMGRTCFFHTTVILISVVLAASAFSERYLGSPRSNPRVYEVNLFLLHYANTHFPQPYIIIIIIMVCFLFFHSLLSQMSSLAHRAGQLEDKSFLIIHPTADGE